MHMCSDFYLEEEIGKVWHFVVSSHKMKKINVKVFLPTNHL